MGGANVLILPVASDRGLLVATLGFALGDQLHADEEGQSAGTGLLQLWLSWQRGVALHGKVR